MAITGPLAPLAKALSGSRTLLLAVAIVANSPSTASIVPTFAPAVSLTWAPLVMDAVSSA